MKKISSFSANTLCSKKWAIPLGKVVILSLFIGTNSLYTDPYLVVKEDIVKVSKKVSLHTILTLEDKEEEHEEN